MQGLSLITNIEKMIVIDDKIVSLDVVEEQFICNLTACKGVCCIKGEGGAPLEDDEAGILDDIYDDIESYLTEEGKAEIAKQGRYTMSADGKKMVTPLIESGACVYLNYDELGIAKCAIQKAYEEGIVDWPKPISCHLYPIRIEQYQDFDAVNYFRWDICKAACTLGKEHKVAVYEFLKEPLVRKYGEAFYDELDAAAQYLKEGKKEKEEN